MSPGKSNLLFAAFLLVAILFFWHLAHTLLVIFAAILLAVFLHALSSLLRRIIPVSVHVSTLIVAVLLVGLIVLGVWLLSPRIAQQVAELKSNLPRAVAGIAGPLQETEVGTELTKLLSQLPEVMKQDGGLLAPASWVFSTAIGFITNVAIILFVGLYLALDPQRYIRGQSGWNINRALLDKRSKKRSHQYSATLSKEARRDHLVTVDYGRAPRCVGLTACDPARRRRNGFNQQTVRPAG